MTIKSILLCLNSNNFVCCFLNSKITPSNLAELHVQHFFGALSTGAAF